jgi:general L-amino acid transport system permease protein
MQAKEKKFAAGNHPDLPPPAGSVGPWVWLKTNLFSSVLSSILTVVGVWFLYEISLDVINWLIIDAVWSGSGANDCRRSDGGPIDGFCWLFIREYFWHLMIGRYPNSEVWRLAAMGLFIVTGYGWLLIKSAPWKVPVAIFMVISTPFVAKVLMFGGLGLSGIRSNEFGGLALNIFYLVIGLQWALPVGVLIALGRQSNMPLVRFLCLTLIAFFRGPPFLIFLFGSSVALPLFLSEGTYIDKLIRVQFMLALYFSTYIAGIIRGGMQAVPAGLIETARASGMRNSKIFIRVILPETLKLVVPGVCNTTISLIKVTTIIFAVGQFDFVGMIQIAGTSPDWLGYLRSGYVFAAVVFFCLCFSVSCLGRYLEKQYPPSAESKRNFAANPIAADVTHAGHSLA